jgi:hypothetical protein
VDTLLVQIVKKIIADGSTLDTTPSTHNHANMKTLHNISFVFLTASKLGIAHRRQEDIHTSAAISILLPNRPIDS